MSLPGACCLSGYSAPHLQFYRLARGNARFRLTQLMRRLPHIKLELMMGEL